MGVIGSAKLLQAIAYDSLLPGLTVFGRGAKSNDEPVLAIIMTYVVAQLTMLFDINSIAAFITMTYLMTFLVTNLACFLLKIGSAPNFRPSFRFFNWQTAAAGTLISGASMFFVDGLSASGCVGILVILFLLIHYTSPPKTWGDVSQSLIYHQVRKYLLRLRPEHVKFWRPQILLIVKDIESEYRLVSFCNSLKKGALFVLGHVLVTDDFSAGGPEARHQQNAWTRLVEHTKIKGFVNVTVAPTAEWGIRNIVLTSGLGRMKPNIIVIDQFRKKQSLVDELPPLDRRGSMRTRRMSSSSTRKDSDFEGPPMSCKGYVTILEDLIFNLQNNVAMAKGFEDLEGPGAADGGDEGKKYVDLWPIQMSAEIGADGESKQNLLTINFDTYTLILQLGCILLTVPSWERRYKLRVAVFVEYETDVADERKRVEALLEKLRIQAEVRVFWLACGDVKTYRVIVNGDTSPGTLDTQGTVQSLLRDEDWWQDLQKHRKSPREAVKPYSRPRSESFDGWQSSSGYDSGLMPMRHRLGGDLKSLLQSQPRSYVSRFRGLEGVSLGMQTHRLPHSLVDYDAIDPLSEESSSSGQDEFEPYVDESNDGVQSDEGVYEWESEEEGLCNDGDNGNINGRDSTTTTTELVRSATEPPEHTSSQQLTSDGLGERASERPEPIPENNEEEEEEEENEEEEEQRSDTSPKTKPADKSARPSIHRTHSGNRFSSAPIPEAKVNVDENAGPSIMFAPESSAPRFSGQRNSIYTRYSSTDVAPSRASSESVASGYPRQAAMPLSFNDLPSRAQHLILNELMLQHSGETVVIMTTLPAPSKGTAESEEASESYLNDLGILWKGLPPCLLVHSNSMTVTMSL